MGRYYHTDINTNIPRIFAKEVFLSIKEYINNREFYPTITGLHPILNGVLSDNMVPPLYGYIASSPKTNATVILKSDEDDPILTTWQYGLGRTVAWNSDMAGRWSKEYVNWNNNLTMWQNMINWTVENYNDTGRNASINIEGKKGIINYKTENQETDIDVSAICTSEEGIQKEITLDPIKPGEYQGEVKLDHPGFYTVNVREEAGEDVTGFINTAVAMQYSPEYRFPLNDGLLELLVDETYGEFIETPEDIYKENAHKAQAMLDLTNLLLILALILFVIDIAFRRLNINYAKYFNKIMGFEILNKIKGNNDKSKKDTKSNLVRPKVQKQKSKTNEKRTKKINTKNAKQEEKTKVNDLTSTLLDKKKDRT
ncbi:MAG: glutamine amidotransferase [Eubacteriales bacterium]